MRGKTRRTLLLLSVLAMLAFTASVQAFSFCFSFGSNNNRYSSYNRYPPPFPPAPAAFYPMDPYQQFMPGAACSPVYPPLTQQPNGVLAPAETDQ